MKKRGPEIWAIQLQQFRINDLSLMNRIISICLKNFVKFAFPQYTCNMDEAKDAYQEAIIDTWILIMENKEFILECELESFLHSVAMNKLRNIKRLRKKLVPIDHCLYNLAEEETIPESHDYPHLSMKELQKFLNKLSKTDRLIIQYKCFENKSWEEVSEIMHIKVNSLKTRKYKILRKLERMILGRG
jgi:RNA polymerase sigma factor (sigma-70 family)